MKNSIIHKSAELFLKYGFKSVTMDDIATELGMSKKTIYTYFETKTKLVSETALHIFMEIENSITKTCLAGFSPIQEIYEIKTNVMRQLYNEQSYPMYQLQKYYPKIFNTIKAKQFEMLQSCVVTNLKNGIEQGFYRKNLDVNFISRLYFNGILGIKNVELFPSEEFTSTYLIDNYLDYHLRAITTEKGLNTLIEIQK
ncbi:TetR/AcrR family transcriptional regulator [Namhaeicola litoreus]|uniref:TetR/AcrR family transcriptional regulator n=1 Tax=Namhaeicola litoreus TaxID=1052145 RepID=A0ABW3XYQ4_9FLAO